MHFPFLHVFLGIIVVAVILAIVWIVKILFQREQYRRERFAFVALTGLLGLAATAVTSLAHKETPWGAMLNLFKEMLGLPIASEPPRTTDHILMVLVLIIICIPILRIYDKWDGAISIRHYEKARYHERTSLVAEGLFEAKRIIRRQAPPPIYCPEQYHELTSALEPPLDTLAWHLQARDLLCLKSQSYEIDRIIDWHDKARCWIGINKKSLQTVALRCEVDVISINDIEEFIKYVEGIHKQRTGTLQNIEFIVAFRYSLPPYPKTITGYAISWETEETLLANLVDFSDYYADITFRAERQTLPDSALTLEQVYTPPSCHSEGESSANDLELYIRSWLTEAGQRQLALLGEYGQGKSTAALMITRRLLREDMQNRRIPVLIELRGKSPRNMTPEEILAGWAFPYRINPQAVMKLLIAGKILLILEGFDEMALIGDSEARLSHFRTLWRFCYPNSKILITGRPNFFLDDKEMKSALGIAKSTASGPYCHALHLQPFTLLQIESALRTTSVQARTEILSLAKQDTKFLEIVSRGSLLYVVSQLWERANLSQYAGRITSAFVMELFIQNSYRRQTLKAQQGPEFMVLNESERKYFMSGIAAYMAALNLPNQITREHFEKAVKALYEMIPISVSLDRDNLPSTTAKKPLKERQREADNPIEDIVNDVRASGILVVDQNKPSALRFAHKSFMEFLIAQVYGNHILGESREFFSAVIAASHLNASHVLRHAESVLFLAEIFLGRLPERNDESLLSCQLFDVIVKRRKAIGIFSSLAGWLQLRALTFEAKIATDRTFWRCFYLGSALVGIIPPLLYYLRWLPYPRGRWFYTSVMISMFIALTCMFWSLKVRRVYFDSHTGTFSDVRLWFICCVELNAADSELARIVGQYWLQPLKAYLIDTQR